VMLVPCRECGKQISTEALSCPHCGVPSPTESEEWIKLERQLDAIAPGGGRLALACPPRARRPGAQRR